MESVFIQYPRKCHVEATEITKGAFTEWHIHGHYELMLITEGATVAASSTSPKNSSRPARTAFRDPTQALGRAHLRGSDGQRDGATPHKYTREFKK